MTRDYKTGLPEQEDVGYPGFYKHKNYIQIPIEQYRKGETRVEAILNGDIIYADDVLDIFEHKFSYKVLLSLIREKKIPAFKAGKQYIFSRQVVVGLKNRFLGIR